MTLINRVNTRTNNNRLHHRQVRSTKKSKSHNRNLSKYKNKKTTEASLERTSMH